MYSESETEEHINGKITLFEWVREQEGVSYIRKPYYGISSKGYGKRVIKDWNDATKFTKITELKYTNTEEIYPVVTKYISSELHKGVNKKYRRKGRRLYG